jgi:Holliday junction DNA helicase RuvA
MLSTISGVVTAAEAGSITVETGHLGFTVNVPSTVQCIVDTKIKLFVYMHWNQEQGPSLYGFEKELDKTVFLLIISCSGIGPKIGLAILSQMGGSAFIQAIQQGNQDALSSISGIGEKKAEQMIVQLKHKVSKLLKSGIEFEDGQQVMDMHNVIQVLSSLNYSRSEINSAVGWLHEQNKGVIVPFDKLVRQALSFLSKKA